MPRFESVPSLDQSLEQIDTEAVLAQERQAVQKRWDELSAVNPNQRLGPGGAVISINFVREYRQLKDIKSRMDAGDPSFAADMLRFEAQPIKEAGDKLVIKIENIQKGIAEVKAEASALTKSKLNVRFGPGHDERLAEVDAQIAEKQKVIDEGSGLIDSIRAELLANTKQMNDLQSKIELLEPKESV